MLLLLSKENEHKRREKEADFKNLMFAVNPKMYKKMYIDKPISDEEIQYQIPKTVGEVFNMLDKIKQAGGPDLDYDPTDNDFSRFKNMKFDKQPEDEPEEPEEPDESQVGEVDGFTALDADDGDG